MSKRRSGAGSAPPVLESHPGGALANVAVAAARAGAEAALVGGVGEDRWGSWLRDHLERDGVGTRWLATVPGADTPIAFVYFDGRREPEFQVYGEHIGATMEAARPLLDEAMAGEEVEALVIGSNTTVGEPEREVTLRAREAAIERGVPVLFDPNIRPNRWRDIDRALRLIREMCPGCRLVRANREEAELITGRADPVEAAEALVGMGSELAVVTDGSGPAVMRGASRAEASARPVEVASPLGAGDAFMGALAAGMAATGWDTGRAGEALEPAVRAGAEACTRWSAQ